MNAVWDRVLRITGLVVAAALAAVTALFEISLSNLHTSGGTRLPLALLVALVGNAALAWFTYEATGRLALVSVPAVIWVLVMLAAGTRTSEGDYLIAGNNWVGALIMVVGAPIFALALYRQILATVVKRQRPSGEPSGEIGSG